MKNENLISAQQLCAIHEIEFSFIHSLSEFGLIEIIIQDEEHFIPNDRLKDLEKMIRMHYELDINIEGIDAIIHLLKRAEDLNSELTALKNRLRLYENE